VCLLKLTAAYDKVEFYPPFLFVVYVDDFVYLLIPSRRTKRPLTLSEKAQKAKSTCDMQSIKHKQMEKKKNKQNITHKNHDKT